MAEQSLDSLSRTPKSQQSSISTTNDSKLSKAQARRLKMPKRNRSAYFLFSMDLRAKLKTELNNSLTPLEMQAKVSQYWKDLNPLEKEKYEQRAKEEKAEYLVALEKFYSNLTPETLAKSKANRPKKPCSAYAHFVRDIKNDLKKENPKLIMQEILHIASDKWKNLSKEIRATYEEKAKLDKAEYMTKTRKLSINEDEKDLLKNEEDLDPIDKQNKRFRKPIEKALVEEMGTKQIKVESLPIKTENRISVNDIAVDYVKMEEYKQITNIGEKPFLLKGGLNPSEMLANRPLNEQPNTHGFMTPQGMNYYFPRPQRTESFNPIQPYFQVGLNHNQNLPTGFNVTAPTVNSSLSLATLMQANINLEEAILRRITEVQNLQAQRLYLQGKLPWS